MSLFIFYMHHIKYFKALSIKVYMNVENTVLTVLAYLILRLISLT